VLLTAAAGFYLGARDHVDLLLLANTLLGTALVAGGTNGGIRFASATSMPAWRARAAAAAVGRLTPRAAMWFASAITAGGVLYLGATVNLLTAVLAALTFASYVLLYTPLKRTTSLNTLVARCRARCDRGRLDRGGWQSGAAVAALFWILFLWQLPHFLALAWLYRDDYRAGGLRMLSVADETAGRRGAWRCCMPWPSSDQPAADVAWCDGSVVLFGALALGLGMSPPGPDC